MTEKIILENISIILHMPRYPENIGAAARAMRNMGLNRLVVVKPENYDVEKILKMATHVASDVVNSIEIFDSLEEAVSTLNYLIGCTARLGKQRQVIRNPSAVAEEMIQISKNNRVGVVFGPEDRGLANEDTRLCDALVNIPTAGFSSLNLAQAVMVMCYEMFIAGQKKPVQFNPRLANRHELEGMYEQIKDILVKISFINSGNPDYWLNNFRKFFSRMGLLAKEVSIIRGLCRQINWYGEKRYNDGLDNKKDHRDS